MTRSPAVVAVLVVLVVGVAACGGDVPSRPAPPYPSQPPLDDAFPVTIEHEFGGTVIPAAPKRIVAIGGAELDALLALGIAPVGYSAGPGPGARFPAGGVPPTGAKPVRVAEGVPGVADVPLDVLDPDLILDVTGYPTEPVYDYFRDIAPTVGPPAGARPEDGVAWQDVTRTVGRAVGKPVEADRLVAATEARIAAAPARYPQLAGRTGMCISLDSGKGKLTGLSVDTPGGGPADGTCARFLAELGMRGLPALDNAGRDIRADEIAAARPDVVVLTDVAGIRETTRTLLPPGLPVADLDDAELDALTPSVLGVPVALKTVPDKLVRALR